MIVQFEIKRLTAKTFHVSFDIELPFFTCRGAEELRNYELRK
jgi:hypothetical protein